MAVPPTDSPKDLSAAPANPNSPDNAAALWMRSLDQIGGADLPLVGGKSYRLAQLKQYGLDVPPGLVLTTHAFKSQLRHHKLSPLWAGSPDVEVTGEALVWLADAVKTKPLEPALAEQMVRQIEAHFGPEVDSFAVRSSVIDEDQRDHTFAGIHLSELGVPRSAIPIAVSRCWASALSEPAVQYRQRHGMSIQAIEVAVLIQPMLAPLCAGVAFTINPLTGSSGELVIEAVWGGGSRLVAGTVQPHFYRVTRKPPDYPLIEQKPGSTTPPAETGQAAADPLTSTNRTRLARQLQQIEALMGAPQDVEWALQDETFFFLQTRPVALPAEPAVAMDQAWTRGAYRQSLPELPSPFFGSLLERSQAGLRQYFRELGFTVRGLGPFESLILGRPFLNITFLKQLAGQVGLSLDGVLQAIGYVETSQAVDPFAIDWGTAWRARHIYRAVYRQIGRIAAEFADLEEQVERVTGALRRADPAALPAEQQLDQLHRHIDLYRALAGMAMKLDLGIAFVTAMGGYWLTSETDRPGLALMTLATRDFSSTRTQLQQALIALGQLVRSDDSVQIDLRQAAEEFVDDAGTGAAPAEFWQRFDKLLARYGDWATYEIDPAWPRYREEPAVLLEAVRHYAWLEEGPAPAPGGAAAPPERLSWKGRLARPLVDRLHELLVWRDRLARLRAGSIATCRFWSLAVGQQWVEQGWLAEADDIFWLTVGDLERVLLTGETVGVTLPATVQSRQETHATYAKTIVPYTLHESQLPAIQLGLDTTAAAPAGDVTIGLPISPGQVRGQVVVARHPQEAIPAGGKIILVMPATGPEWLPLLHQAAGLIVETGGLLSHGSVIAREYGLPAVANIPQATQRFRTGDQLLVDGSTGVVQLLERGPAAGA